MDVSVVILSYNVASLLKACIESVLKWTKDVEYEVIVVDSQSTDNSVEIIKSFGNKVKFIQSLENGGFSKGNNLGIKEAKGKYVLLLNPDTLFLENSIYRMKTWMDAHEKTAVSSCQLVNFEQKITFTGGYFPTLPRAALWAFFIDDLPILRNLFNSYHPVWSAKEKYSKEFNPDWVTGAFFFMRKSAVDKIGPLDENIFMYTEEMEWCMRAKKHGFQVGYTPITKIIHLERKSSGDNPENAIMGEWKGIKYIYNKYFPPYAQYTIDIILVLGAFFRALMWLIRMNPKMARVYLKAMAL